MKFEKKEIARTFEINQNDNKVIKLIKKIESLLQSPSLKKFFRNNIYLTGGFLRDRIKKKKVKDYDFVLHINIFSIINSKLEENKLILEIDKLKLIDLKLIDARLLTFYFQNLEIQIKEIKFD